MRVIEPFLKKRIDGSHPATNPIIGELESHFKNHNQLSFHFGTDQKGVICNYAWKVLVANTAITEGVEEEACRAVKEYFLDERIKNDASYLSKCGFNYQIIVIDDTCNWKKENNFIVLIDCGVDDNKKLVLKAKVLSQKDFQKLIVQYNGVNLTNKPLIYATTELEGFLSDICIPGSSRTDVSLFPGDADLVLYNNNYGSEVLVEFKKHTKSGFGTIEYQSFTKYYYKDRKKYDSLSKLCGKLGLPYFYNVIYSTKPEEYRKIKVEKISSKFQLLSSQLFQFKNMNELDDFLSNTLR